MNTKEVSFLGATFSIALALLFVARCAIPYRRARGGEGYEDSQVATDEFLVSFPPALGGSDPYRFGYLSVLRERMPIISTPPCPLVLGALDQVQSEPAPVPRV
jgi:hypothetical protein